MVAPDEAAAWQRGAVASVVSIRPGLGYDFAYPTKIFAALACGTPVVYAGPGPARADLLRAGLGWVADYDARAVGAALLAAIDDGGTARDRGSIRERSQRLRRWVLEHRSMTAALDEAARVLLDD